jgi:branched-chain amino acid transport system substrate-binding protein
VLLSESLHSGIALACALALLLIEVRRDRRARPGRAACLLLAEALLAVGVLFAVEGAFFIAAEPLGEEWAASCRQAFAAARWLAAGLFLAALVNRLLLVPLEVRTERAVPLVVRRFLVLFLLALTGCGALMFVYDQKLTGLLATSGILAMIIGLAVQMNISNLFSGIVVFFERPFRVGDWIQITARQGTDVCVGKIIDVTWRTTRVETKDHSVLCIPNSVAAESVVCNHAYPDNVCRERACVRIAPDRSPDEVEKLLLDGCLRSAGVLAEPPPVSRMVKVSEGLAEYELLYFYRDFGTLEDVRREVWRNVWWHLTHAGINLDTRPLDIHVRNIDGRPAATSEYQALRGVEVFRPFSSEALEELARRLHRHRYAPGEAIVEQGGRCDSMFVILEGCVGVEVAQEGAAAVEVARMGVPEVFGEMALLTGEPRRATVRALTRSELLEITKADITPLLESHPEAMRQLADIMAQRKLASAESLAGQAQKPRVTPDNLLQTISNFLGLRGARRTG